MIKNEFIKNTVKNLCNFFYDQVIICQCDNFNNGITINDHDKIFEEFIQIHKLFNKDLKLIVKISQNITLEIIKNINRNNYNFESCEFFTNSIKKQINLVSDSKYEYLINLLEKC